MSGARSARPMCHNAVAVRSRRCYRAFGDIVLGQNECLEHRSCVKPEIGAASLVSRKNLMECHCEARMKRNSAAPVRWTIKPACNRPLRTPRAKAKHVELGERNLLRRQEVVLARHRLLRGDPYPIIHMERGGRGRGGSIVREREGEPLDEAKRQRCSTWPSTSHLCTRPPASSRSNDTRRSACRQPERGPDCGNATR